MNTASLIAPLKENKNILLFICIILLSLGLLFYVLFMNKQTSQFFGNNKPTPQPTQKKYQRVDTPLNTVLNSDTPKETAEKNNLAVVGTNEVKVLITLEDESFVFTDTYGKEVLRYGKYIQAIVKFDKLEELTKNPKIKSIIAPLKSISPQKVE